MIEMICKVTRYGNGTSSIKMIGDVSFFDSEQFILKINESADYMNIHITKPNLDYVGKTVKYSRKTDDIVYFLIRTDAESGNYYLDEEVSSVDELVFVLDKNNEL